MRKKTLRAAVAQLDKEQTELAGKQKRAEAACARMAAERDEARRDLQRMTAERDDALAELRKMKRPAKAAAKTAKKGTKK